jgi:hypothetical protein
MRLSTHAPINCSLRDFPLISYGFRHFFPAAVSRWEVTISAQGVVLRMVAFRHHFNTEKSVSIVTSCPVDFVGIGGSDT